MGQGISTLLMTNYAHHAVSCKKLVIASKYFFNPSYITVLWAQRMVAPLLCGYTAVVLVLTQHPKDPSSRLSSPRQTWPFSGVNLCVIYYTLVLGRVVHPYPAANGQLPGRWWFPLNSKNNIPLSSGKHQLELPSYGNGHRKSLMLPVLFFSLPNLVFVPFTFLLSVSCQGT